MKKHFFALFLALVFLCPCLVAGATAQQIIINDVITDIPADMGSIQERDDRTFVPVRFICNQFYCSVTYDDWHQSATLLDPTGISYLLTCDSEQLFVFPKAGDPLLYNMDTKPFMDEANDRMYVPLRFLAEAMGYTVDWNETTETVSLTQSNR